MSEQMKRLQELLAQLSRWEKQIEEALVYSRHTHTFDDIVGQVLQGRLQFHSFLHSFAITEKIDYPQFSTLHCFLAGGDIEAVLDNHDAMHQYGRELGCKYLSTAGRKGWEKMLKDKGWEPVCTTLFKEVEIEVSAPQTQEFLWPQYEQLVQ